MKKLNLKVKKDVLISIFVALILVLGIGLMCNIHKENKEKDNEILLESNRTKEVKVDDIETDNEKEIKEPVINTDDASTENIKNTETIKKETVPVKPEPPKVKPKTKDDITNKNKVPTYSEKEVKPEAEIIPKGGDTNSKGQVYFPGFGWVNNSGSNNGQAASSDGDINKQVGTMN